MSDVWLFAALAGFEKAVLGEPAVAAKSKTSCVPADFFLIAEYALRGASKPIGISEYELTRALPLSLQSSLPSVEEIEAELAESANQQGKLQRAKKINAPKPSKSAAKKLAKKERKK